MFAVLITPAAANMEVALRAYNGKYVTLPADNGQLMASSPIPGQREKFLLIDHNGGQLLNGDAVSFQTSARSYLIAMLHLAGRPIHGSAPWTQQWETFLIHKLSGGDSVIRMGDNIGLQVYSGSYVGAMLHLAGAPLQGDSPWMQQWETFTLTGPAQPLLANFPLVPTEYRYVNRMIDSSLFNYPYAYGPSIFYEEGRFHMVYASTGVSGRGWDYVRYSSSPDGRIWTPPVVILKVSDTQNEQAACDPSIIRYQAPGDARPYYYLFYSGAIQGVGTAMFVARADSVTGPYYKYSGNGTWVLDSPAPKAIIRPVTPTATGTYGAGQQTVVVKDGYLHSWWTDDSLYFAAEGKAKNRILYAKTRNPVDWPAGTLTNEPGTLGTQTDPSPIDAAKVDVKYDPALGGYVMYYVGFGHSVDAGLTRRFSRDGVHWSYEDVVCNKDNFVNYAHNLGVSGTDQGWIIDGRTLVVYGAPSEDILTGIRDNWTVAKSAHAVGFQFPVRLGSDLSGALNRLKGLQGDGGGVEGGIPGTSTGGTSSASTSVRIDLQQVLGSADGKVIKAAVKAGVEIALKRITAAGWMTSVVDSFDQTVVLAAGGGVSTLAVGDEIAIKRPQRVIRRGEEVIEVRFETIALARVTAVGQKTADARLVTGTGVRKEDFAAKASATDSAAVSSVAKK